MTARPQTSAQTPAQTSEQTASTSADNPSADRRLAAGCLLGSFDGTVAPAWLLERVRDGLGGVLLFAQNVVDDVQVAELCATLRAARADVVIAIDEEGGDVTRLDARHGSDTPCPAAFGIVDDPTLTFDAYAELGQRIISLGIDLTLAPCADINSNPLNPIIGVRAFGITADLVARHVAAAVHGFRSSGLSACAKHYPGHGDTSADTHLGQARVGAAMDVMTERELVPFATAMAAGVDAVLTAHIVADSFDTAPVSLSALWTEHLRDTMGFDGVIITDALDMDAVAEGRGVAGVAAAAIRALAGGADLLCLGSNFDASMTDTVTLAVFEAITDGQLDRRALEQSRDRVVALRRERAATTASRTGAASLVAARAIVATGALPGGPFAVLECRPRPNSACFNVSWGVAERLDELGWPTSAVHETDVIESTCDALLGRSPGLPVLVIVRDIGVRPWQRTVVEHCQLRRPGQVVVVEMGWPQRDRTDVDSAARNATASIVTHGAARISARALIDRLVVKES